MKRRIIFLILSIVLIFSVLCTPFAVSAETVEVDYLKQEISTNIPGINLSDYEFDKDEGILVIENTEYYVELNSRATEMEIVECDGNPSFVGFVFEKQ